MIMILNHWGSTEKAVYSWFTDVLKTKIVVLTITNGRVAIPSLAKVRL